MNDQKTKLEEVLSNIEKQKLTGIASDTTALSALRKLFLFGIYYNGVMKEGVDPDPTMNFALSIASVSRKMTNEEIGEVFRGQMEGISSVEAGFEQLMKFKPQPPEEKSKPNPAR